MAGIGIIANPHSKLNKRNPQRPQLLSYIAGERGRFEITNNLNELQLVARDFLTRRIEILAINGGDGTISRTLTAFVHAYRQAGVNLPKIALLRGGTMNMLADNLGVKGRPEQVLYRLIEAHSAGPLHTSVRLASLEIDQNIGFLFASGTSARFLDVFYRNKTGALGSFWLVLKISASYLRGGELFHSVVQSERVGCAPAEQAAFEHQSLGVFAATVERLPLKMRLFPEASRYDDRFQVVSVTYREGEIVTRLVPDFMWRPEQACRGKLRFASAGMSLSYPKRFLYTLDGELYESPLADDSGQTAGGSLALKLGPPVDFVVV